MKILHCVASLSPNDGGPARSVPSLASAVASAGCDVRVWTGQLPTVDLGEFSNVSFVHGDIDEVTSGDWTPDVIHDHGMWLPNNHAVARFARHRRIPRLVSPRGMLQPWCLRHRRVKKHIAWRLYQHRDLRSADCLHATSEAEIDQFRKLGFHQPIIHLPNGVRFPTSLPRPASTAKEGREVLFLSRIHPVKGIENLVTAWSQVAKDGWRLRIVGSDSDGHSRVVADRICELGLSENVTIEGPLHGQEKWRRMIDADVFVLPSFSENFGIVVAEALAAGTPVITTTGTPWSGLPRNSCGWWVAPDVASLADALADALSRSRDELQVMGRRGREWVGAEYSWELIGQRMRDAYVHLFDEAVTCDWLHRVRRNAA